MIAQPKEVLTGLVVGESPRWHAGRLWFANWGAQQLVAMDADGTAEVVGPGPKPVGYSIDWLPDGRLVATGEDGLVCRDADGQWVPHTDLTAQGTGWNEIVVGAGGNVYVNDVGFQFGEEDFRPGGITLVRPDGTVRRVADGVAFPNGMVVTPDNTTLIVAESFANQLTAFDIDADGGLSGRRIWAEVGGDGICLDAECAIWCASMTEGGTTCTRVADGGEILDRIALEEACFACMLGGETGTTLFLMVAEWRGAENMASLFESQTGRVLTTEVPVPHAGRP
jgi:sugar lactone lactonase YvrE